MLPSIAQAIILGILQGLTEFLPISSSAHLLLLPWMFSWEGSSLTFDTILHLGTALSLLVYFRREWLSLLGFQSKGQLSILPRQFPYLLVVASIPAGLVGVLFESAIDLYLRTPLLVAFNLSFFGWLLLRADTTASGTSGLQNLGLGQALLVGSAQALALIPGVSRSGVTITAALAIGLKRTEAARLSFLLGTPLICGAGLLKLLELLNEDTSETGSSLVLLVGVIVSFGAGLTCIRYLLAYLQSNTFLPFVWYRFVLTALILIVYFLS